MAAAVFSSLPGAVVAEAGPDAGAVAHFGNPLGEQRALEDGRAVVELASRAVLTIAGADRLSWLDSISSQRLSSLQPGESTETLLLDPSGRIEHAVKLVEDGERLWLLVDAIEAESLLAFLLKMRFMLRVEPSEVSADYAVIGSTAPLEPPTVGDVAPIVWHDPWNHVSAGGHQYAEGPHPAAEWSWFETIVPLSSASALRDAVAAGSPVAAGSLAVEALRVAAWRPRFATEVDERSIPHELDWLRSAVHLNKGCYRGQETVAKVHNLGHPPRRLVQLHLDGSDGVLPEHGAEVIGTAADGSDVVVGQVTSSALHHELGPVALAVVKRSADPAAVLRVRTDDILIAAAQQLIVPPSAGAEAEVPRLPRLGAVQRAPRRPAEQESNPDAAQSSPRSA